MKIKRNGVEVTKQASKETFAIKQTGGAVFIEGFANRATIDRGDDLIDTKAWELENFKKNPIILFNHGFDTLGGLPVGKATQVKPTEEGLFIKVRLSNSEAPAIKMVRDLVSERILQSFSVGFDPKETEKMEVPDGENTKTINKITKAELFEVSIVGIPMNQDSLFELSEKSLTTKSLYDLKKDVLEHKGATYAAELHTKLKTVEDAGQDRDEILELLAEASSMEIIEVKDILAGNTDATEDFKIAVESALDLKELAEEDEEEKEDAEKEDEEKDEKAKEDEDEKEDSEDDKEGDSDSEEKASDSSEDDDEKEDDESSSEKSEDDSTKADFESCVSGKVPGLVSDGMDHDAAVAAAISECQESGKCQLTPESKVAAFEAAFAATEKFKETGEWDFETLSSADILFVKTEQTSEVVDTKQAEQEGQDVTQPIDMKQEENDFGSPFLEQQKQTNVLLGTLISAVHQLNERMDGLDQKTELESDSEETQDSEKPSEEEDISEKSLDHAEKSLDKLTVRLKKLGY